MAPAARKAGLDRQIHCANPPRDQPAEAVPEINGLFSVALNVLQLGGHRGRPSPAACSGEDLWAIDDDDPYVLLYAGSKRVRRDGVGGKAPQ